MDSCRKHDSENIANISPNTEVFILPPHILEKYGINLWQLQQPKDGGTSASKVVATAVHNDPLPVKQNAASQLAQRQMQHHDPALNHIKESNSSVRASTSKVDDNISSICITKSNSVVNASASKIPGFNVIYQSDVKKDTKTRTTSPKPSSIMETASLMKRSIFLSPNMQDTYNSDQNPSTLGTNINPVIVTSPERQSAALQEPKIFTPTKPPYNKCFRPVEPAITTVGCIKDEFCPIRSQSPSTTISQKPSIVVPANSPYTKGLRPQDILICGKGVKDPMSVIINSNKSSEKINILSQRVIKPGTPSPYTQQEIIYDSIVKHPVISNIIDNEIAAPRNEILVTNHCNRSSEQSVIVPNEVILRHRKKEHNLLENIYRGNNQLSNRRHSDSALSKIGDIQQVTELAIDCSNTVVPAEHVLDLNHHKEYRSDLANIANQIFAENVTTVVSGVLASTDHKQAIVTQENRSAKVPLKSSVVTAEYVPDLNTQSTAINDSTLTDSQVFEEKIDANDIKDFEKSSKITLLSKDSLQTVDTQKKISIIEEESSKDNGSFINKTNNGIKTIPESYQTITTMPALCVPNLNIHITDIKDSTFTTSEVFKDNIEISKVLDNSSDITLPLKGHTKINSTQVLKSIVEEIPLNSTNEPSAVNETDNRVKIINESLKNSCENSATYAMPSEYVIDINPHTIDRKDSKFTAIRIFEENVNTSDKEVLEKSSDIKTSKDDFQMIQMQRKFEDDFRENEAVLEKPSDVTMPFMPSLQTHKDHSQLIITQGNISIIEELPLNAIYKASIVNSTDNHIKLIAESLKNSLKKSATSAVPSKYAHNMNHHTTDRSDSTFTASQDKEELEKSTEMKKPKDHIKTTPLKSKDEVPIGNRDELFVKSSNIPPFHDTTISVLEAEQLPDSNHLKKGRNDLKVITGHIFQRNANITVKEEAFLPTNYHIQMTKKESIEEAPPKSEDEASISDAVDNRVKMIAQSIKKSFQEAKFKNVKIRPYTRKRKINTASTDENSDLDSPVFVKTNVNKVYKRNKKMEQKQMFTPFSRIKQEVDDFDIKMKVEPEDECANSGSSTNLYSKIVVKQEREDFSPCETFNCSNPFLEHNYNLPLYGGGMFEDVNYPNVSDKNVKTDVFQTKNKIMMAGETVKKKVVRAVEEPVDKTVRYTVEEMAKEPIEETVEKPVEEPVEKTVEETVEEPVEETVEQTIEDTVEETVEETFEETFEERERETPDETLEESSLNLTDIEIIFPNPDEPLCSSLEVIDPEEILDLLPCVDDENNTVEQKKEFLDNQQEQNNLEIHNINESIVSTSSLSEIVNFSDAQNSTVFELNNEDIQKTEPNDLLFSPSSLRKMKDFLYDSQNTTDFSQSLDIESNRDNFKLVDSLEVDQSSNLTETENLSIEEVISKKPAKRGRKKKVVDVSSADVSENAAKNESAAKKRRKPLDTSSIISARAQSNKDPDYVQSGISDDDIPLTVLKKKRRKLAPDELMTCSVCSVEMTRRYWPYHNLKVHNNLSWAQDEEPIDLSNEVEVSSILRAVLKSQNRLFCYKCKTHKKSVDGYFSHELVCGKSKEEIDSLRVPCPECKRVMMPSSLKVHLRLCPDPAKINVDFDDSTSDGRKRKAAERANETISILTKDTPEKYLLETFKGSPFTKRVTTRMANKWQKEINQSKDRMCICTYTGCGHKENDVTEMFQHVMKCRLKPTVKFECNSCEFTSTSETEINAHRKTCGGYVSSSSDVRLESLNDSESEDYISDASSLEEGSREGRTRKSKVSPNKLQESSTSLHSSASIFKDLSKNILNSQYINNWMVDFCRKNYTMSSAHSEITCLTYNPLSQAQIEEYLQLLQKESCNFAFEHYKTQRELTSPRSIPWKKYRVFESEVVSDSLLFYVGGNVNAMAWLPLPTGSSSDNAAIEADEYLALSVSNDMIGEGLIINNLENATNVIQIWSMGRLRNEDKACKTPPKMVLGLAHNRGVVWDLKWCPSGCYDPLTETQLIEGSKKRLGLLAAACGDGDVCIFAVTHPSLLPKNGNMLYETKPAIILRLNNNFVQPDGSEKILQPTKLFWSENQGHSIIAVGYSNGVIALYDTSLKSPLVRVKVEDTFIFRPYYSYQFAHSPISGLLIFPNTNPSSDDNSSDLTDDIILGFSSSDGVNLVSKVGPGSSGISLYNRDDVTVISLAKTPKWPVMVYASDDPGPLGVGGWMIYPWSSKTGKLLYKSERFTQNHRSSRVIDVSQWGGMVFLGDNEGAVKLAVPYIRKDSSKHQPFMTFIYSLYDTISLQPEKKPLKPEEIYESGTYEEFAKKFGLVLTHFPTWDSKISRIPRRFLGKYTRQQYTEYGLHPGSISHIETSPNEHCSWYVAYTCNAGIIHVAYARNSNKLCEKTSR